MNNNQNTNNTQITNQQSNMTQNNITQNVTHNNTQNNVQNISAQNISQNTPTSQSPTTPQPNTMQNIPTASVTSTAQNNTSQNSQPTQITKTQPTQITKTKTAHKKHITNSAIFKNLKIRFKTQDFLEVEEIIHGFIITKYGQFLGVVEVFPTNFELLSKEEQDFKIRNFAALINSLDFNLQIIIDTKKLFVTEYINYLNKIDPSHSPPGLQRMFKIYKQFITNIITNQNVFQKRFFLIVPYASGVNYSITMPIARKQQLLEQAVNFLTPKLTHMINMIHAMGLEAKKLTTLDLIKYFYEVYNPEADSIPIEGHKIELK